jgi:hypothetical protein
MGEDDLASGLALRLLRLHQHLDIGLGPVELRFHGVALRIELPRPEVSHDREDVVVRYDWTERPQAYILACRGLSRTRATGCLIGLGMVLVSTFPAIGSNLCALAEGSSVLDPYNSLDLSYLKEKQVYKDLQAVLAAKGTDSGKWSKWHVPF